MQNILRILSKNSSFYFTVPNRYTIHPEPHFNIRFLGFLPTIMKKVVVAKVHNININEVENILSYSCNDLKKLLEKTLKMIS